MYADSLNSGLELAGQWWINDHQSPLIAGRLHVSHKFGIWLYLDSSFNPPEGEYRVEEPKARYSSIRGTLTTGEVITLFQVTEINVTMNFTQTGIAFPAKLAVKHALIGAHLPPEYPFKRLTARVSKLEVWLGRENISREEEAEGSSAVRQQTTFVRSGMEAEGFEIRAINSRIEFHCGYSEHYNRHSSLDIKIAGYYSIDSDEERPLDWFLKNSEKVAPLLTMFFGRSVSPSCITLKVNGLNRGLELLTGKLKAYEGQETHPKDFFLSPTQMKSDLGSVFNQWFQLIPKLSENDQLANSILSSSDMWLHVEFLILMQALEGFHRALHEGRYTSEEQYKKIRDSLLDAIPNEVNKDHKKSLESRIRYGNEISLAKRLKELCGSLSEISKNLIFSNSPKLLRKWVDTRNFYTHWSDDLKPKILTEEEMACANVRLAALLRVLYLRAVGVSTEDIDEALQSNSYMTQQIINVFHLESKRVDPKYASPPLFTIRKPSGKDR